MFSSLRNELYNFYLTGDKERSLSFANKCFAIMDSRFREGMSVTEQKLLQYQVITENFEPVIFKNCPYFFETGVLTSLSDGSRNAKGYEFTQANGWVYRRNEHLFKEQDEKLYNRNQTNLSELLYLICGPYNDVFQHYNFNNKPILKGGLKSIYEKAKALLPFCENEDQREFLNAVCEGMLYLKKMAAKFANKAQALLAKESDPYLISNLELISSTAGRIPWEAPQTFYEALATLAFMRTAFGSLEGVGPNTFGRLDKDLISFYRSDIKKGIINKEEAFKLICQFLIIWDCHYDHDMKMISYADHELENTYTLGGCDEKGKDICNELTIMFLKATREQGIIFPKIKCRFSKDSTKEYFDEINLSVTAGTSTVLFQNDDAVIPALLRAGRPIEEARNYMVTGCWGLATDQEKFDHGNYLNLLKPFEYSIHNLTDKMEKVQMKFEPIDNCTSFEEIYSVMLKNFETLLVNRLDITRKGGQIVHKVDRFPIFSSTLENCIENKADYTMGGAKYNDDYFLLFGFPNIVDSLLAIKELVFEQKKYTLKELLFAVRNNWEGFEEMRLSAVKCHGWGDGSDKSCELANRFNNDLYAMCQRQTGTYGGKVNMGHLTYTEIRWWGEKTKALPDGRKDGEYFAQGLTPSRLKHIPNVGDVIHSFTCIDPSTLGANSVVNIILPNKISLEHCEAFLRAVAGSAIQSLQLNCVSKEQLLDAQKNPEAYPELIVRVTGFSAKFTSLSTEWQNEVITRNFYE